MKLQSESVEIAVVPQLGAKILELMNRDTGRQWLWQPDSAKLFTNKSGDLFETSTMSGSDECLPTIAACVFANRLLPDHGEVWSRPWKLDQAALKNNRIRTQVRLIDTPLEFERSISLCGTHGEVVQIEYQLTNLNISPEPFLWAFHPLMRIEPGDQIMLPVKEVSVDVPALPESRHERWAWSDSLARMELPPQPGCAKMFATDFSQGLAEVVNRTSGDRLAIRFDPAELPALGIWITRGGWHGYHHFAIEPTHAPFDSLLDAVLKKKCPILQPSGVATWSIQLELHCDA